LGFRQIKVSSNHQNISLDIKYSMRDLICDDNYCA